MINRKGDGFELVTAKKKEKHEEKGTREGRKPTVVEMGIEIPNE
jgi:hypothetical protein